MNHPLLPPTDEQKNAECALRTQACELAIRVFENSSENADSEFYVALANDIYQFLKDGTAPVDE